AARRPDRDDGCGAKCPPSPSRGPKSDDVADARAVFTIAAGPVIRARRCMSDFHTRTFGKWILAGEHAVLRGSPALAFPLRARGLELRHSSNGGKLTVHTEGLQNDVLHAC